MDVNISDIANEFNNKVSPVREIMNYADKRILVSLGIKADNFISFGGGWVNHSSPEDLRESYLKIISDKDKFHFSGGYSPTPGENFCKDAIINFEESIFSMQGLLQDEIIIGQSSTQLTYFLLKVLLNKDDKILFLDPTYCNYQLQNNIFNPGEILNFQVIEPDNFVYSANNPEKISLIKDFVRKEKPKIVFLVSPDNPTGQVLSDEFVDSVYNEVKKYGGAVVIDFAYKTLVFGDYPKYFSKKPDGNFITIHSNSKWGRNLGRRMGWLEAPEYILRAYETFQSATLLCPDRLHQMAFAEYIETSIKNGTLNEYISKTKEQYKKTAEHTESCIERYLKLPYISPSGGIYICLKVSENSAKFVQKVLKNTGVLFIPGWGFGSSLSESVRLSFGPLVNNYELIDKGLNKVGEYLSHAD